MPNDKKEYLDIHPGRVLHLDLSVDEILYNEIKEVADINEVSMSDVVTDCLLNVLKVAAKSAAQKKQQAKH